MNDTPTRNPVLRFAPSPNGLLHLGHAWSALVNLRMAHELGATMLLRIEDIDTQRCTPALEAKMLLGSSLTYTVGVNMASKTKKPASSFI